MILSIDFHPLHINVSILGSIKQILYTVQQILYAEHSKEMDEPDVTEELGRELWDYWDLNPQSSKEFRDAYSSPYIVSLSVLEVP